MGVGPLVCRCPGLLDACFCVLLGCWVGLLDCRFVGLLLCSSVGLLVCCCPDLLKSQPGPAECAKRLNNKRAYNLRCTPVGCKAARFSTDSKTEACLKTL